MITRRDTLVLVGMAALAAKAGLTPALAQNVNPAELLKPDPLGDVWLGPETAKVTIVEYASLTCNHCAHFHNTTLKDIKKRYVDSGQVRFTLRPFALNEIDTALYMVALSEPAKYYGITDLLFETQEGWLKGQQAAQILAALKQTLRQAGISEEKFNQTLKDQRLLEGVNASRKRASEVFKVESTPTLFVNGVRQQGSAGFEAMEKLIKPALGA